MCVVSEVLRPRESRAHTFPAINLFHLERPVLRAGANRPEHQRLVMIAVAASALCADPRRTEADAVPRWPARVRLLGASQTQKILKSIERFSKIPALDLFRLMAADVTPPPMLSLCPGHQRAIPKPQNDGQNNEAEHPHDLLSKRFAAGAEGRRSGATLAAEIYVQSRDTKTQSSGERQAPACDYAMASLGGVVHLRPPWVTPIFISVVVMFAETSDCSVLPLELIGDELIWELMSCDLCALIEDGHG